MDGWNKCSVMIAPTLPGESRGKKEQSGFLTRQTAGTSSELGSLQSNTIITTNKRHKFVHKAAKDPQQRALPRPLALRSSGAAFAGDALPLQWVCLPWYPKGAPREHTERRFTRACSDRKRGNGFSLTDSRFRSGIRKNFSL